MIEKIDFWFYRQWHDGGRRKPGIPLMVLNERADGRQRELSFSANRNSMNDHRRMKHPGKCFNQWIRSIYTFMHRTATFTSHSRHLSLNHRSEDAKWEFSMIIEEYRAWSLQSGDQRNAHRFKISSSMISLILMYFGTRKLRVDYSQKYLEGKVIFQLISSRFGAIIGLQSSLLS